MDFTRMAAPIRSRHEHACAGPPARLGGVLAAGCAAALLLSCGASAATSPAVPAEADAGAMLDAGPPDTGAAAPRLDPTYPSPHQALPQIGWNGGRVLTAPSVVTVTFGADPDRATLEQFGDTSTQSGWWDEVRAGYCAGATIEAATDPDVGLGRAGVGYYLLQDPWAFAGGEVGDLCVDYARQGGDEYLEGSHVVQRSWSNSAAAAGHDPCVLVPAGAVYFGAAPAANQQEVRLAVGASTTVDVTAFSAAPMDNWTLSAIDFGLLATGTSHLSFAWDKTIVNNGYHVKLTVTLKSAGSESVEPYAIVATSGRTRHFWPAAVVVQ